MKFSLIITEQKTIGYTLPKFHQFKIDVILRKLILDALKMQDIKVSLLGINFIPDNDSKENILEVLYDSSVIDSQAQIQNFFKGEGLIKRFLKKV